MQNSTWYNKGLRFKCTSCGKCCTGFTGFVWITPNDIKKISKFLNISKVDFLDKYTIRAFNKISLKELYPSLDCIFLSNKKCQIYPIRPIQCQTYPWWENHLRSKKTWDKIANTCEGIDHKDAPLISYEEIQKELKKNFL